MRDAAFFMPQAREGFYVSDMMKRFWASQMAVTASIDEVCRKHDIPWFADYGTLLGTVRHKGFIPWDDDLDIVMLRHDYERFIKVARDELPKGYEILETITHTDPVLWTARVINSLQISLEKEYLDNNQGCPYTVGVDVFVLDGLSDDEEFEKDRQRKLTALADEMAKVSSREQIFEYKRKMEELSDRVSSKDAKKLACMANWVRDRRPEFDSRLFKDRVWLDFEDTKMPVPARYEEVLRLEFGDYMSLVKGGGMHEYPLFSKQERIIESTFGKNSMRYRFNKSDLEKPKRPGGLKGQWADTKRTIESILAKLDILVKGNYADALLQLLTGCQNMAVSLGEKLEKLPETGECIKALEVFCEAVFALYNRMDEESLQALKDSFNAADAVIGEFWKNKKKEIVFLYFDRTWWDGPIEALWEEYKNDPQVSAVLLVSPYYLREHDGSNKDECYDDEMMRIINGESKETGAVYRAAEYDFFTRCPDMIINSFPYDGWNTAVNIPPGLYTQNIAAFTDRLVYVPSLKLSDPDPADNALCNALSFYIEQPAVVFSDEVWMGTGKMRDFYIKTMTALSGEEHRSLWESKIIVKKNGGIQNGI